MPVNSDGKNDYGFLRSKLLSSVTENNAGVSTTATMNIDEGNNNGEKNTVQSLERFVQRLRMVSQ